MKAMIVHGCLDRWHYSFLLFFLGPAMRKIVSILNPIYWTTAKEIGGAVNGFTLTNAVFKRETQVEFATGQYS